jgi:hypothetical protein
MYTMMPLILATRMPVGLTNCQCAPAIRALSPMRLAKTVGSLSFQYVLMVNCCPSNGNNVAPICETFSSDSILSANLSSALMARCSTACNIASSPTCPTTTPARIVRVNNAARDKPSCRSIQQGHRIPRERASEYCQLSCTRHQATGRERSGVSGRPGQGRHSHSNRLHDRTWRHSDVGDGDEGWSHRLPTNDFNDLDWVGGLLRHGLGTRINCRWWVRMRWQFKQTTSHFFCFSI